MNVPILERLKSELLLADGAMGTWLFSNAPAVPSCVELLNLEDAHTVERAHRLYVEAGAQLIESNTFAANRIKLGKRDLVPRLKEINERGVGIARAAAGDSAFVAGSIGPLGALMRPVGNLDKPEAKDIFIQHVAAVAAGRPDVIWLETFGNLAEALVALEAAKDAAPDLPVLVSLSVLDDGRTPAGDDLLAAFRRLRGAGAELLGVNCAAGPQVVYDALAPIIEEADCPISVMPNAGYPERVDDRAVFRSTPAYFARWARQFADIGANIIGGCCGTTPAHIAAMAAELAERRPRLRPKAVAVAFGRPASTDDSLRPAHSAASALPATRQQTAFERKLGREFVITVELSPPRGIAVQATLEHARSLAASGADAVNIPDNPTARLRLSGVAVAHAVASQTALATILHYSCRDRNLLALQSELLGAAALGVTGIVALTGDPTAFGDFPKATSVFDVTALGLTEIVNSLNHGMDHGGNVIGSATRLRIGAAASPAAKDQSAELFRLERKIAAGADFIVTQPVFALDSIERFMQRAKPLGVPIIAGILILKDRRNAEFLHHEVPGMMIPEEVRRRLGDAADPQRESVAIARQLLEALSRTPGLAGAYIVPQERYDAAAEIIAAASRTSLRR